MSDSDSMIESDGLPDLDVFFAAYGDDWETLFKKFPYCEETEEEFCWWAMDENSKRSKGSEKCVVFISSY